MNLLRAHLIGLPQLFRADHAVLRRGLVGGLGHVGELGGHSLLLVFSPSLSSPGLKREGVPGSLCLDAKNRLGFTILPCWLPNYPLSRQPRYARCATLCSCQ